MLIIKDLRYSLKTGFFRSIEINLRAFVDDFTAVLWFLAPFTEKGTSLSVRTVFLVDLMSFWHVLNVNNIPVFAMF